MLDEIRAALDAADNVNGDAAFLGVLLDQATPEGIRLYTHAYRYLTWAVGRLQELEALDAAPPA